MAKFEITSSARAVAIPSPAVVKWMKDRVQAAGGDPAIVPDMEFCLLRPRRVRELTGLSLSTYYRLINDGVFPKPIRIDRQPSEDRAA
jgi:Prophage CP4-57 regulatory protein (AlpA)